jgi:hypothetical protein
VRGAALVARARMGDKNALPLLDKALHERGNDEHAGAVDALCRNAREVAVELRLEEYLKVAVGVDLAAVAESLTTQGRASGRETVRSMLALDVPPTGARRLRLVRALSRRPTEKDVEILAQLFPQPGEEALNVELAVALAAYGDPSVRPILRAALWGGSFDVSVLAAALLADTIGVRVLIEEIQRPPATATAADLRRVGFALGECGGIEALRALSQVTADPWRRPSSRARCWVPWGGAPSRLTGSGRRRAPHDPSSDDMNTWKPSGVVTLLTDFGSEDPYVGMMKGVLLSAAPGLAIVDLTHGVPPQCLRVGAWFLAHAFGYFPAGTVHVAVVDPGVGSSRRLLVAEDRGHAFLAPDNGLLGPVLSSEARVFELDAARFALRARAGRSTGATCSRRPRRRSRRASRRPRAASAASRWDRASSFRSRARSLRAGSNARSCSRTATAT